MKLFDVYPLYDINIVKGQGCKVWERYGISGPLRRPCRHLHRTRASPLCGDDQQSGSNPWFLFKLGDQ